jgi:hypothetical protein
MIDVWLELALACRSLTFFRSDRVEIPCAEPSGKSSMEPPSTLFVPDFLLPDGYELVLVPFRIS